MPKNKLERGCQSALNAHQADTMNLWDSIYDPGLRYNLTLEGQNDDTKFDIYGLTKEQLGDLYVEIALILGKPPEPTVHHLEEIHELIGNLVNRRNDQEPLTSKSCP